MATGAAIGGAMVLSAYFANQGNEANADAISDAADANATATQAGIQAQLAMFAVAREDLAWAREMGVNAGEAPGASQEMRDASFTDAPTLGEFSFDKEAPDEFQFAEEGPGDFKFEFDADDEIFKWKQKETQRLVDQKMAAMGNMSSSANLTRSHEAMMSNMEKEVERQFDTQWKTHTTQAADFQDRYNRAAQTHTIGTADFANTFNREMSAFNAQQGTAMSQFGMTHATEVDKYNKAADISNVENTDYWNKVNVGLSGSGASAAAATSAGAGIANTYAQGGQNAADIIMAGGANQASYYSGMAQLPWQAMGAYNAMNA